MKSSSYRSTVRRCSTRHGLFIGRACFCSIGSLRERSYSRLVTEEAARILRRLGAEARIFNPSGLPLPDSTSADHPKVQELRDLSIWSEAQVWCSPERHGSMTGVMKAQIDWLPLSMGGVRPTQGRTLAVMQVPAVRRVSMP